MYQYPSTDQLRLTQKKVYYNHTMAQKNQSIWSLPKTHLLFLFIISCNGNIDKVNHCLEASHISHCTIQHKIHCRTQRSIPFKLFIKENEIYLLAGKRFKFYRRYSVLTHPFSVLSHHFHLFLLTKLAKVPFLLEELRVVMFAIEETLMCNIVWRADVATTTRAPETGSMVRCSIHCYLQSINLGSESNFSMH